MGSAGLDRELYAYNIRSRTNHTKPKMGLPVFPLSCQLHTAWSLPRKKGEAVDMLFTA